LEVNGHDLLQDIILTFTSTYCRKP